MKYVVFLFSLFSFSAFAESCVSLDGSDYVNNSSTIEQCTDFIVLTAANYNSMVGESFNVESYDYGLQGVIKLFVAGLAIGWVLAYISKLKR